MGRRRTSPSGLLCCRMDISKSYSLPSSSDGQPYPSRYSSGGNRAAHPQRNIRSGPARPYSRARSPSRHPIVGQKPRRFSIRPCSAYGCAGICSFRFTLAIQITCMESRDSYLWNADRNSSALAIRRNSGLCHRRRDRESASANDGLS